ncbi:VOC family protein [Muricoccus aerilatus]|uniref:VOC family protein n=1 Tax=Muricoccus aerilatus TaxID=452982 RepID=UPI0005C12FC3|nr:VOC family protein [Roseomonas aerilata]
MPDLSLTLLLVDSPAASTTFYADLLGREPAEASPTFAMFTMPSGAGSGLWSRHTVEPAPGAMAGAAELAFAVPDLGAVHADWSARGLRIAQVPTGLDIGRTFVALAPDGHQLRVFTPAG